MFEKEAQRSFDELDDRGVGDDWSIEESYVNGFTNGAEFAFNKANEWHYVKDGDLPKDEEYKWCISRGGYPYIAKYEELFVSWRSQENKDVLCPYVWKEIVLPEPSKYWDLSTGENNINKENE